jgi:hypothetical protein
VFSVKGKNKKLLIQGSTAAATVFSEEEEEEKLIRGSVMAAIIFNNKNEKKVKVNVKLSLCLTKHHAMKTYWESGGIAPRILELGTTWR